MQKATIARMKQRDTDRKVQAHDPELALGCKQREINVTGLDGAPVDVEQYDSDEGKRKVSNSEHGHIATAPEENHASCDDEGPDKGPDDPEDAEPIEVGLWRGRVSHVGGKEKW